MPFYTYQTVKTIKLLTNFRVLRKGRFVFRQIFPLLLQFIVLFKIGFTKELIYILFISPLYISENKSICHKDNDSLFLKSPSLAVPDDIKDIDDENTDTNTDEDDKYPEGDSCPVCKKVYNNTLFWCTKRLQDDFPNWTSGNQEFDQCIRNTQLKADGHSN